MKKQTMTLLGGPSDELRVDMRVLQEAFGALLEGMARATRYAVEGHSTRTGRPPSWMDAALQVDVTGLKPGSAALYLEAYTLGESVPDLFSKDDQADLLRQDQVDSTIAGSTPLDLFVATLSDALGGDSNDMAIDRKLLDSCVRLGASLGYGFTGIRFNGLRGRGGNLTINAADFERLKDVRDQTPAPEKVRVSGKLDTISDSKPEVLIRMADETIVMARLEQTNLGRRQELWGQQVVLSGLGHFSMSGKLLRMDAESLQPAGGGDKMFERTPRPRLQQRLLPTLVTDDKPRMSELYGTWPGDETEEELLAMLAELR